MGICRYKPICKGYVEIPTQSPAPCREMAVPSTNCEANMQQTFRCGVVGSAALLCLDKGSKSQPSKEQGVALQENAVRCMLHGPLL